MQRLAEKKTVEKHGKFIGKSYSKKRSLWLLAVRYFKSKRNRYWIIVVKYYKIYGINVFIKKLTLNIK